MNHIMGKNTKNVLPKKKKKIEKGIKKINWIILSYCFFLKLEIQKKLKFYVIFLFNLNANMTFLKS